MRKINWYIEFSFYFISTFYFHLAYFFLSLPLLRSLYFCLLINFSCITRNITLSKMIIFHLLLNTISNIIFLQSSLSELLMELLYPPIYLLRNSWMRREMLLQLLRHLEWIHCYRYVWMKKKYIHVLKKYNILNIKIVYFSPLY